jgi:hypothetical protein
MINEFLKKHASKMIYQCHRDDLRELLRKQKKYLIG